MCLCNECINMTSAKTGAHTEQESDMIAVAHCCGSYYQQILHKDCSVLNTCVR